MSLWRKHSRTNHQFHIKCPLGPTQITGFLLQYYSTWPTEQVSVPHKWAKSYAPVFSLSCWISLSSLLTFNPSLNTLSLSLFILPSPMFPTSSPSSPSLSLSLFPGNSLCSAAQVWQRGVCGGGTPRSLRLLWWVVAGQTKKNQELPGS